VQELVVDVGREEEQVHALGDPGAREAEGAGHVA